MRNITHALIPVTMLAAAGLCSASPLTLVQTDFNSAAAGSYTNGGIINGSASAVEQMSVAVTGSHDVSVVTVAAGNNAVQFTDNETSGGLASIKKTFTALSTTASGNNYIEGTFDFTPLLASATSNPTLEFYLNAGSDGAGSNVTAVQITLRGTGGFSYKISSGNSTGTPTLTAGVAHRFYIYADLSSGSQDTWGVKIVRLDTDAVVYDQSGLTTRSANVAPDRVVFNASANSGAANASPFALIDNVNFSAMNVADIPEPAGIALMGLGGLMLAGRRR